VGKVRLSLEHLDFVVVWRCISRYIAHHYLQGIYPCPAIIRDSPLKNS
jgi:hypothetical protein